MIAVIGQSPPLKAQIYPYDTTLFYKMLEWANISLQKAQEIFTFEALTDEFPGKTKTNGHKVPTVKENKERLINVIIPLIDKSEKVILLGRPVQDRILNRKSGEPIICLTGKYLLLPHPSRRNYSFIMENKDAITLLLKSFLHAHTTIKG